MTIAESQISSQNLVALNLRNQASDMIGQATAAFFEALVQDGRTIDAIEEEDKVVITNVAAKIDEQIGKARQLIDDYDPSLKTDIAGIATGVSDNSGSITTLLDSIDTEVDSIASAQTISSASINEVLSDLQFAKVNLDISGKPALLQGFNEEVPLIDTDNLLSQIGAEPDLISRLDAIVVPEMSNLEKITVPSLIIPTFDYTFDDQAPEAPSVGNFEELYGSFSQQLKDGIRSDVDSYIQEHSPEFFNQINLLNRKLEDFANGQGGLTASQENQFLERAKSKNFTEYQRVVENAYKDSARRGFTIPGGAVFSAVNAARQSLANNNATSNNEMAIKQAEMQQERIKFSVQLLMNGVESMRASALQYFSQMTAVSAQSVDYAKAMINASIDLYNLQVKAFEVKLAKYRADAEVYSNKVKAALATVDIYKAQIEAQGAQVNIDRAKIDAYRSNIDALVASAGLYRSRIDAVATKANISKIKLDLFGEKLRAHQANADVNRLQWEGYLNGIKAQEAVANNNKIDIDVYRERINAHNTRVSTIAKEYEMALSAHRANLDVVKTNADITKAKLDYRIQGIKLDSDRTKEKMDLVRFRLESIANRGKVGLNDLKTYADFSMDKYKTDTSVALNRMQYYLKKADSIGTQQTAKANILSSSAAAALGSMVSLAQVSAQE